MTAGHQQLLTLSFCEEKHIIVILSKLLSLGKFSYKRKVSNLIFILSIL